MSTTLKYTPVESIPQIRESLVKGFNSGKSKSIAFRKKQLLQLCYMVQDNLEAFQKALASDLGRPVLEANFLELGASISEALGAYKNVDKWAKKESAPLSLNFGAMKPHIRKEPKGVVLIIVPFNYPVWLTISPVAGAIAAGCAVVLKPSELSPATSNLFEELFPKYLDQDLYRVVQGAVPETTKLLELQWDHVMYTGSGNIGKIVATAAAKHLTPVTLELGGKSPAVIDPKMDMDFVARRLLWGKTVNAGQTCVAPDYVLIPKEAQEPFVNAMKTVYNEFYPEGARSSDSYSRIISDRHFQRLKNLLDATQGKIAVGGETDASSKFIAPSIVQDVPGHDSLMSEELFGPILPIVPVPDIDAAVNFINARDHPLALYVFSNDANIKTQVADNTRSGAIVNNETLLHCGVGGLPFGGVGPSGYGAHTGKFSFDTFTHQRASLDNPKWVDMILNIRYPPYTAKKLAAANRTLFPSLPAREGKSPMRFGRWLSLLVFTVGIAAALKNRTALAKLTG